MVRITYKVNGREVPASGVGRALESAMRDSMKRIMDDKARQAQAVRCPDHPGRSPRMVRTSTGYNFDNICCEKMRQRLDQALK